MAKRFSISFNTTEFPGRVRAVYVELGYWFMRKGNVAHLDLCEHPLYPELVQYVKANPYRPKAGDD